MEKIGDGRIILNTKEEVMAELKKGRKIIYSSIGIISYLFSPFELVSSSIFKELQKENIIQEVKFSKDYPTTERIFALIES